MINWRVTLMSLIRKGNLEKMYNHNLTYQYEGNEDSIKKEMADNAMNIFKFHFENNSQYRAFLKEKGFKYTNIKDIKWEEIPIITKADLQKFNPVVKKEVYNYSKSGGSTNKPFRYPASKDSALGCWPYHWLMYEMCGGKPYDKVLMLMGYGSHNKELRKQAYGNLKNEMIRKIYHKISNFYTFNAFEMNEQSMLRMYNCIVKEKIKFIYGYSSAINQFLRFLKDKDLHLFLKGIFMTSDNKIMSSYKLAQEYCNCEAYNQYGAHDGGIFTFECKEHAGLHIMHDSCTLEIINHEIILTAVKNKAFPFIRYKVGDIAVGDKLITEKCKCGRTLFRLQDISGRNTYYVKDKNGVETSIMLFTFPFDVDTKILQYQILEENNDIKVNVITDEYTVGNLQKKYGEFFFEKLGRTIIFETNQPLYKLPNGKLPLFYKK